MGPHLHRCLMGKDEEESQGVPKFFQCAEGDVCLLSMCERMTLMNSESQIRSSHWQPQWFLLIA